MLTKFVLFQSIASDVVIVRVLTQEVNSTEMVIADAWKSEKILYRYI